MPAKILIIPFLEEVAVEPGAHILNGAIFALWGFFDLERSGIRDFAAFRTAALGRLERGLPLFDLGYWSKYDLLTRSPATSSYHALHIAQLRALNMLTGRANFTVFADRWEIYRQRHLNRIRAFFFKVLKVLQREMKR